MVIWNPLIKLYRLVVVSRRNIDLLTIISTREGFRIRISRPKSESKSGFQQRVINQRIDLHRHHQCHQHHHRRHQQLQLPRLTAHSLHRHIIIIQTRWWSIHYPLSIITTTILPRLAAHSLTIHSSTATLMAVVMIILVVVSNQLSYSSSTTTSTAISVV